MARHDLPPTVRVCARVHVHVELSDALRGCHLLLFFAFAFVLLFVLILVFSLLLL